MASGSHLDLSRAPYVLYGVTYIDLVSLALFQARDAHLDLIRASYVLYGVKYVDLVSLAVKRRPCAGTAAVVPARLREGLRSGQNHGVLRNEGQTVLDLSRAPYILYGVKYIDLVSLAAKRRPDTT